MFMVEKDLYHLRKPKYELDKSLYLEFKFQKDLRNFESYPKLPTYHLTDFIILNPPGGKPSAIKIAARSQELPVQETAQKPLTQTEVKFARAAVYNASYNLPTLAQEELVSAFHELRLAEDQATLPVVLQWAVGKSEFLLALSHQVDSVLERRFTDKQRAAIALSTFRRITLAEDGTIKHPTILRFLESTLPLTK